MSGRYDPTPHLASAWRKVGRSTFRGLGKRRLVVVRMASEVQPGYLGALVVARHAGARRERALPWKTLKGGADGLANSAS